MEQQEFLNAAIYITIALIVTITSTMAITNINYWKGGDMTISVVAFILYSLLTILFVAGGITIIGIIWAFIYVFIILYSSYLWFISR